jgi:divalent metal cation (Fe/Co/Zn/Cd) transporter
MATYIPQFLKDKNQFWLTISSLLLLGLSFVVNYYAVRYTNTVASNSVSDIILSNTRVFPVMWLYVYGPIVFWVLALCLFFSKPKTIPFVTKSIALFILIRSVFISLTHIAVYSSHLVIEAPKIFGMFTTDGDLFFSGHTGLPFLLALIFWENKYLRYFFIASSLFFGTVVLLGHMHYSIDVLAAFFITYSIYQIAVKLFKRDKALFDRII